jgi:hypothetical protein
VEFNDIFPQTDGRLAENLAKKFSYDDLKKFYLQKERKSRSLTQDKIH